MKRESQTSRFAILRRRAFAVLSILLLVLCLATLALWVRSYDRGDGLDWLASDRPRRIWMRSLVGEVELGTFADPSAGKPAVGWHYDGFDDPYERRKRRNSFFGHRSFIGFGVAIQRTWTGEPRMLTMPHWFLVVLFAILPAFQLRAMLRSRRYFGAGQCQRCGYDLRATPDRCPECGTGVSGQKSEVRN